VGGVMLRRRVSGGASAGAPKPDAAREAAARYFPDGYVLTPLGGSTGYSGSAFARVEAEGAAWCLRRWPRRVGARRLAFVHRALALSRASGFRGVPTLALTRQGTSAVRVGSSLYDAQEWLAGAPLGAPSADRGPSPNRVRAYPAARLVELAAALARFHGSTTGMPTEGTTRSFPLVAVLAEVEAAVEPSTGTPAPRGAAADEDDLVDAWLKALPRAVRSAARTLARHPALATDAGTLCHGDLWPNHVFVAGGGFSGFVDFESLGFASPLADLGQLVLHFGGWDARLAVLEAYDRVRALPAGSADCLSAAVALDAASEGTWALTALRARPSRAQREAHLANLRDLLAPLRVLLTEAV
jgi:aminoglycoside phosphotransferase (APT) family kinase protein